MKTITKRYPVVHLGYVAGHATTKAGALRLIRKMNSRVSKVSLSRGKKPLWQAIEWKA
ncbi:hypothetical protein [Paramagnetospirillum caucaseum]|uniref:hypothetical protein n=1 Tax=Paramagnetospirillum caucaseum TaxID=1244869 RepID=UPI0003462ED7|nr:hypothetical protein [Paramagnetospirillum caucaseum]